MCSAFPPAGGQNLFCFFLLFYLFFYWSVPLKSSPTNGSHIFFRHSVPVCLLFIAPRPFCCQFSQDPKPDVIPIITKRMNAKLCPGHSLKVTSNLFQTIKIHFGNHRKTIQSCFTYFTLSYFFLLRLFSNALPPALINPIVLISHISGLINAKDK